MSKSEVSPPVFRSVVKNLLKKQTGISASDYRRNRDIGLSPSSLEIAPMGRTDTRAGEIEIVWLSFPPVCPRRPEVGIHPGEWSCTHSHWPFSATPPSLWPGRELRKFHCSVPGE